MIYVFTGIVGLLVETLIGLWVALLKKPV